MVMPCVQHLQNQNLLLGRPRGRTGEGAAASKMLAMMAHASSRELVTSIFATHIPKVK